MAVKKRRHINLAKVRATCKRKRNLGACTKIDIAAMSKGHSSSQAINVNCNVSLPITWAPVCGLVLATYARTLIPRMNGRPLNGSAFLKGDFGALDVYLSRFGLDLELKGLPEPSSIMQAPECVGAESGDLEALKAPARAPEPPAPDGFSSKDSDCRRSQPLCLPTRPLSAKARLGVLGGWICFRV